MIKADEVSNIKLNVSVQCHFCGDDSKFDTDQSSDIPLYDQLASQLTEAGWAQLFVKHSDDVFLCCSSCLEGQ